MRRLKDYYKILEVSRDATNKEIKKAYRKLSLKYHPDRNQGDKGAEEKFKEITKAYNILSSAELKEKYDQRLNEGVKSGTTETKRRAAGSGARASFNMNNLDKNFEDFFGFNPNSNEKVLKKEEGEKQINTDAMFNSFFSFRKRR